MKGKIHSIETCGTVDGPGIRYVLFIQGCNLRCKYCHNPDTWDISAGKEMSVDEIITDVIKYKSYMNASGGGITITGGEPLLQVKFLNELVKKCKKNGIHIAIDTSGSIFNDNVKELLQYVDLVLLDIKLFDPVIYKRLTGVELKPTLKFLEYVETQKIDTWIRYVLVPTWTDNLDSITALSTHLSSFSCVKKIEILPFHKMGEYKWKSLGHKYELSDVSEPEAELVAEVKEIFTKHNPDILVTT